MNDPEVISAAIKAAESCHPQALLRAIIFLLATRAAVSRFMRVLSLGAGVQSTAVYIMALHGEIPPLDLCPEIQPGAWTAPDAKAAAADALPSANLYQRGRPRAGYVRGQRDNLPGCDGRRQALHRNRKGTTIC